MSTIRNIIDSTRTWFRIRTLLLFLVFCAFVFVLFNGYAENWKWVGVSGYQDENEMLQQGKTFWDWMELLLIPIFLLLGAASLNSSERKNEQKLADDQRREQIIQNVRKELTDLILREGLKRRVAQNDLYVVARTIILTAIHSLQDDGRRKGILIGFISEMGLIKNKPIDAPEDPIEHEAKMLPVLGIGNLDLQHIEFKERYLDTVKLPSSNFSFGNLEGSSFRNVDFQDSTFHKANLKNTSFMFCNLKGTNFDKAKFSISLTTFERETIFAQLIPKGTFLTANVVLEEGTIIVDTCLREAILSNLDLRGAVLTKSDLSYAELEGANLRGATIAEASLVRANLQRANLRQAHLTGGRQSGYYSGYLATGSDLSYANLTKANLREANLGFIFGIHPRAGIQTISTVNLYKAILVKADLRKANLSGANLAGADLSNADLRGANFCEWDSEVSKRHYERFAEDTLRRENITWANLEGAILINADLRGAKVTPEQLSQAAILTNAILPNGKRFK